MWNPLAVLLKDFYKAGHKVQYPPDTILVYSNLTPRGTRRKDIPRGVVAFGFQYFVKRYLIEYFKEYFFDLPEADVVREYSRRIDTSLGPGMNVDHIRELHRMQYLPIVVKAVPEGTIVPYRVPVLTIRNTRPEFFWLTNMLETLLSNVLFLPLTSATTAFQYRVNFEKYAEATGAPKEFVPWQGHDFSMRGIAGIEAAMLSGAAHLLSFTGTDTIPAIDLLERYYGADCEKELIGGSVPATEHSVMCMGLKDGEPKTFERLIEEVYPRGIVSIVSDTWDFWTVLTTILPRLRSQILARDGKVVIRPDSGDPVKIVCGDSEGKTEPERMGAIQTLYNVFGGEVNAKGFKQLDPHIGLIYGDSITLDRQVQILDGLKAKGFASSNVVLGIGSYTYQYVTRDTDGWAVKATYGETKSRGPQAIYKDPKTDSGVKKSARGLLRVQDHPFDEPYLIEDCTWEQEKGGMLQTIFENGKQHNFQTLSEIRGRLLGR